MKRTHRRQNCAQMPGTTASRDPLPLIDRYIVRKRRRSHSYFRLSQPPPSTTFLITLATISSALFLPFQSDQATNSQLALAFQTPRTRDEYFRAATPNHKSQQMLQNEATNKGIEFNGRESRTIKELRYLPNSDSNSNSSLQVPPSFQQSQLSSDIRSSNFRKSGSVKQYGLLNQQAALYSKKDSQIPITTTVKILINSYTNRELKMTEGMVCSCPKDKESSCTYQKNDEFPCQFSFTFLVSAPDQEVLYHSTDFIRVDSSGMMHRMSDLSSLGPIEFGLTAKPATISVFVHNLGLVIDDQLHLVYKDYLYLVDSFTLDLNEISLAGPRDKQEFHLTLLKGRMTGTELTLGVFVQCNQGWMGRSCDLKCDKASARTQIRLENMAILGGPNRIDANYPRQQQSPPMSNVPIASNGTGSIRMRDSFTYAICHSELPSLRGLHYECRYIDSSRSQVDQCRFCEYGVISGTHGPICMTKMEDWLKDFSDNVEPFYQTLTIIFAVLFAILLIVLIIILILISTRRKSYTNSPDTPHFYRTPPYLYDRQRLAPMPPATVTPLLIKNGIGAGPLEGPDHWIKPMIPPAAIQHGLSTSRFLTQHRPISSTVNERMPSQMSARGEEDFDELPTDGTGIYGINRKEAQV